MTGPFVGRTGGAGLASPVALRDRRVSVVAAVDCPTCGVLAGRKCLRPNGSESGTAHPVRRRMAVRAENNAIYSAEDVAYARGTTVKERQLARRRSGLQQGDIAEIIGLPRATFRNWESGDKAQSMGGAPGAAYGSWLRTWLEVDE